MRRLLFILLGLGVVLLVTIVGGGLYLRQQVHASLPLLTGTVAIGGLSAPVEIVRDGLGVPTITAGTRPDAAGALGFLHAQDRFFQMDLQRRQAAGELAALAGARALEVDRATRVHRFRVVAKEALARATPEYRALLEAYAAGVNAGLDALGATPPEYLMLRATPEPWRAEDSILTVLAMFNTLQGRQGAFEAAFGTLADTMPPPMYEFLTARGSEWDAPVVGGSFPRPPIPGPEVFDLRNEPATEAQRHGDLPLTKPSEGVLAPRVHAPVFLKAGLSGFSQAVGVATERLLRASVSPWPVGLTDEEAAGLGSNNWAVAGTHTASGAPLVANDMHLAIGVPNIWYRASMVVPDRRAPGESLRLTGVTLPGIPSLVVGSNGFVAWGFTNSGGDWSDLVIVEPDPRDPERYLTPDGPRQFERSAEAIAVHGGQHERIELLWTMWGPVVRTDHRGRRLAQRWVAHDPSVLVSDVSAPEQARTLDEALTVAAGAGIPAQNFVAADRSGRIGWTIAGPIPRRVGFDGSRPVSWADGSRRWDGYLQPHEFPRIVDPPRGRIWTANAPVVNGEMLSLMGEGGYADGIRARLIRDRLLAIDRATPDDMLRVQLDDSALFHERWRGVVLDALAPAALEGAPLRAEFRNLVETTWTGRAEPASVSYRLVRTFRTALARQVLGAITAAARRADGDFDYGRTLRSDGPLWALVAERPTHLLDPAMASWDAQILAAIDAVINELTAGNRALRDRSWGEFNRAMVLHPLAGGLPVVGRWMNMPPAPLPGDVYTPRAHSPRTGPSERMAVSPGREHEGILHMPGGQSGHPLSPHYGDQHAAWLNGDALPFLPGPGVTRLTLTPRTP